MVSDEQKAAARERVKDQLFANILKLEDENSRMRAALVEARDTFAYYARHHADKVPPDTAKAQMNSAMAQKCDDALTPNS